ncbi:MAG: hypothetical protein A3G35_13275 [candidate division NC10 bacterium RIFCSPLOWO2_12_FULL_66_18]|nr:MAG: hypothetical protein A3G35_13275 [candidate division NC10 bacterium RIFCSPLOWO2_12_FULL_66_18]
MGATYHRRGKKSWLVTVYAGGKSVAKMVHSAADAKELVRMIHRQELAGINVLEAIRKARASAPVAPSYPTLREAVPEWIDSQVRAGELRRSTVRMYTGAVTRWVFPHVLADGRKLGDLRLDEPPFSTIDSAAPHVALTRCGRRRVPVRGRGGRGGPVACPGSTRSTHGRSRIGWRGQRARDSAVRTYGYPQRDTDGGRRCGRGTAAREWMTATILAVENNTQFPTLTRSPRAAVEL